MPFVAFPDEAPTRRRRHVTEAAVVFAARVDRLAERALAALRVQATPDEVVIVIDDQIRDAEEALEEIRRLVERVTR